MSGLSVLRAVANRLNSTPIEHLPSQVGYLATSISSCRGFLQNSSSGTDHGSLLHKLKTRVSALLHDRTPEGRFCGIVVAKAMVEAGGSAVLLDSGNWIRAIISCLNKSDSPEVKKLGVLAVAHVYLSTANDQQLVREITTPTLPAFISASLSIIRPTTSNVETKSVRALSSLLAVVLRSWDALLEHFPSTIRPSATSIRSISLSLVSDEACPTKVRELACRVLAKLHFCAPKNTAALEWSQSCSQIFEATHDTTDLTFRAILEDWTSTTSRVSKITRKQKSATTPSTSGVDSAGLGSWSGVSEGCSRVKSHLDLLRHSLTNSHSSEVNLPLGSLFDLTSRLSAVTIPTSKYSPRTNNDITREEREELWLNLPRIHTAILDLYHSMVLVFGQALYPVRSIIASQIWDIFEAEQTHEMIRGAAYRLITSMLASHLLRFSKADSASVRVLVKHCCADLSAISSTSTSQLSLTNGNSQGASSNDKTKQGGDLEQLKWKQSPSIRNNGDLYSHAYALLPVMFTYGNLHLLEGSSTMRAQLDSTAILLNHHEAILASVLYPPGSSSATKSKNIKAVTPSLIPFLARSMESNAGASMTSIQRLGYEAMLRPRMPVVRTTIEAANDVQNGQSDDEASIVEEEDISMLDEDDQTEPTSHQDISTETQGPSDKGNGEAPAPQTNSMKRDFTTLLEQSANEQLAASATQNSANTLDTSDAKTPDPVSKRLKAADDGTAIATSEQPSHATSIPDAHPIDLPSLSSTSIIQASSATNTTGTNNLKEDEDEDHSSDSDVPLIDATLVGISDSEDDDDEA